MNIREANGKKIQDLALIPRVQIGGFGSLFPYGNSEDYKIPSHLMRGDKFGSTCKSYILNQIFKLTEEKDPDSICLVFRFGRQDGGQVNNIMTSKSIDNFISIFNEGLKNMGVEDTVEKIGKNIRGKAPTDKIYMFKIPNSVYRKPFLIDAFATMIRTFPYIGHSVTKTNIVDRLTSAGDMWFPEKSKVEVLIEGNIKYSSLDDIQKFDHQGDAHSQGFKESKVEYKSVPKKKKPEKDNELKEGDRVKLLSPHDGAKVVGALGTIKAFDYRVGVDFDEATTGATLHSLGGILDTKTGHWIPKDKLEKVD